MIYRTPEIDSPVWDASGLYVARTASKQDHPSFPAEPATKSARQSKEHDMAVFGDAGVVNVVVPEHFLAVRTVEGDTRMCALHGVT